MGELGQWYGVQSTVRAGAMAKILSHLDLTSKCPPGLESISVRDIARTVSEPSKLLPGPLVGQYWRAIA